MEWNEVVIEERMTTKELSICTGLWKDTEDIVEATRVICDNISVTINKYN